jgi:heterodisulfide reductase subunit A-like polyferredoxin
MIETCNLRGEVLRLQRHNPGLAFDRFAGLLDRTIHRARSVKPLPTPHRTYNFTTAVIGQSEAALNSAQTLANLGFEVFMFGTTDKPLSKKLDHPNIHPFENSMITGFSGTVGDFQIFVETDSFSQVVQVGAVILGEKARKQIPYIHQASLPGRFVASSMQKRGVKGIPYLLPGSTSVSGLFLACPEGLQLSERMTGAAAAVLAAAVMPRGPRRNKGYTVVVDENGCRGCGRCIKVCPYQAINFKRNAAEGWRAVVDEALCKGCGNCISVCPSNAADSPYRDQAYLEQMIEEVLVQ